MSSSSQSAPPPHHGDQEHDIASEMADLQATLEQAPDAPALLAAVMAYAKRFRPSTAALYQLPAAPHVDVGSGERVARWSDAADEGARGGDGGSALPFTREPAAAPWLAAPRELFIVENVADDPRCDQGLRALAASEGWQALAILPLYSQMHRAWQGVLRIEWNQPHRPDREERGVYRLLMGMLAAAFAGRRAASDLAESLDEILQIYEVITQINSADGMEAALQAAGLVAWASGANGGSLLLLESDGSTHEFATVAATVAAGGERQSPGISQRLPLDQVPLASLWRWQADEPILIGDVQADPQVDAASRTKLLMEQHRAVALLPLRVSERVLGAILLFWPAPYRFRLSDQRLYVAVARNAALMLDRQLLIERMQRALRERQEQNELIHAVLEHLPMGVEVVEVPSRQLTLSNRKIQEVLGQTEAAGDRGVSASLSAAMFRPGTNTPLEESERVLIRTLTTGETHSMEVDLHAADGSLRTLECTAAAIRDSSGAIRRAVVLLGDISRRKQSEQERLRLQDEMIRLQAAALAERSTPLIPINNEIVVMPIIGSLDSERGSQLLDALLHGVSQKGARVAIVDITGAKTIDTLAARTLTDAAQSLRLLGVETVITGIRAEVAQTLIRLGVRLDGVVVRNNLESGIAYGLKFTGRNTTGK